MVTMISVVVPLYNKASHIGRAIDSVLAQSVHDFELIVVDDGSTDGGAEAVFGVEDPRVRLVRQANAGVSAARNRGAKEAASEVVAFLDADDTWEPDFLETVVSLRERFPRAAVWGTAYRIFDKSGGFREPGYRGGLPVGADGGLLDFFAAEPGGCALHSSAVLVDRDALFRAGGFPVGIVRGEDHDTWLRLALRNDIAWLPHAKVVVHEDAENRTDGFVYLGNYPFFESARAFQEERGLSELDDGVYRYLAQRHTGLFRNKLLTGERDVLREIVRDCLSIDGYWWKCSAWYLLSFIPYPVIKLTWMMRQRAAGRDVRFPRLRPIRQPDQAPGRHDG